MILLPKLVIVLLMIHITVMNVILVVLEIVVGLYRIMTLHMIGGMKVVEWTIGVVIILNLVLPVIRDVHHEPVTTVQPLAHPVIQKVLVRLVVHVIMQMLLVLNSGLMVQEVVVLKQIPMLVIK
jgi:hypothetical protein